MSHVCPTGDTASVVFNRISKETNSMSESHLQFLESAQFDSCMSGHAKYDSRGMEWEGG